MEKKSERLEVRLGYKEKLEFSEACETQGDTPSGAIRRFISGYVRRADTDLLGSAWRNLKHRRLILGSSAISLTMTITALTFLAYRMPAQQNYSDAKVHNKVFARYDKDSDGVLQIGDLAPADEHVHKVLDIDGSPGISQQEFWANGRMIYGETTADNIIFDETTNGSVTIKNYEQRFIVVFDFRTNGTAKLAVYQYATDEAYIADYDRTVVWTGLSRPSFYFNTHGYAPRT